MGLGWTPNRAGIVRPGRHEAELEGSRRKVMTESVYKVIELIGTSSKSWNEAAKAAVERAAETLRDLRIAEVIAQDVVITDGKVEAYRVKIKVSFKYEGHH
jgi:dodecin